MPTSMRKENVFMAKLAEKTKQYQRMVEIMDKVVACGEELSLQESLLLSSAYKYVISGRRSALIKFSLKEKNEESLGNEDNVNKIRIFKEKIEDELTESCNRMIKLLDSILLPYANDVVSKVLYRMMKGDFYRYLAEFKTGTEFEDAAQNAFNAYKAGHDIAKVELTATNPIRLALILNFAVFYYQIVESNEEACNLAKKDFDEAIDEFNTVGAQGGFRILKPDLPNLDYLLGFATPKY